MFVLSRSGLSCLVRSAVLRSAHSRYQHTDPMQHSSSAITSSDDDDRLFQDAFSSEHEDDADAFPFAIDDGDADADGDAQQDEAEHAGDENNDYEPLFPDDGEIAANNQDDDTSKDDNVGGTVKSEEANGKEAAAAAATNSYGDALDSSTAGREFSIGEDEDEGDDANCEIGGGPPIEKDTSSQVTLSSALLDDVDLAEQNGGPEDSHEKSSPKEGLAPPTPIQIAQTTSSGESWEPVEDDGISMNNTVQYELLPGLFAHLSDDAVVGLHDVESYTQSDTDANNNCQTFDVIVSAKKACLGSGSFLLGGDVTSGDGYVVTARDVAIRAQLLKPRDARTEWDVVLRDLNVSVSGGMELDPQAERTQVVEFLAKFGCGSVAKDDTDAEVAPPQPTMPARRMTKEEWQVFLRNVREDKRATSNSSMEPVQEVNRDAAEKIDFLIPNVKVFDVSCQVSKEKTINFPQCSGTSTCTLRTLLEYYFRSILNTIDEEGPSDGNSQLDSRYSVADVTSVKASIVGAAAGAAVAGPIGFLAGSYLGSQLGRKHSGAVVGATAGCLFGPVGLIAGACVGESRRNLNAGASTMPTSSFGQSTTATPGLASAAADHVASNKYEYAGTAGVVAGATAGSVAGPVGMVAGAFLGSVSARKATENASSAAAEISEREGRQGYRFGDVTRGLVARGKEARGAGENGKYQFGDLTRGLFGGRKNG